MPILSCVGGKIAFSDQASKEDLSSDSQMKYFLQLKRSEQQLEIAKNLEYISETSKETYIRMMKEFKIESQKAKKKESKTTDMQGVYHKLLYQIILDARETVRHIYRTSEARSREDGNAGGIQRNHPEVDCWRRCQFLEAHSLGNPCRTSARSQRPGNEQQSVSQWCAHRVQRIQRHFG